MKKLNDYLKFDCESFFKNKKLIFIESREDTKGIKVVLMITYDNLNMNEYEKFNVRISASMKNIVNLLKKGDKVELFEYEKGVVWGDYKENLTVYAKIRKIN